MIIEPKDIYTFYAVEYYFNRRNIWNNKRGVKYYLNSLRTKYIDCLRDVVIRQINYYIDANRINIPMDRAEEQEDFQSLKFKMEHTLRGDRERVNDKWVKIVKLLIKLDSIREDNIKGLFLAIDRVNNAVHNAGTTVLDKINSSLGRVFDIVHVNNVEKYYNDIDKDVLNNLFIINKKEEYMKRRWGVY